MSAAHPSEVVFDKRDSIHNYMNKYGPAVSLPKETSPQGVFWGHQWSSAADGRILGCWRTGSWKYPGTIFRSSEYQPHEQPANMGNLGMCQVSLNPPGLSCWAIKLLGLVVTHCFGFLLCSWPETLGDSVPAPPNCTTHAHASQPLGCLKITEPLTRAGDVFTNPSQLLSAGSPANLFHKH